MKKKAKNATKERTYSTSFMLTKSHIDENSKIKNLTVCCLLDMEVVIRLIDQQSASKA